jgi:hypothetical protein
MVNSEQGKNGFEPGKNVSDPIRIRKRKILPKPVYRRNLTGE